MSASRDQVAGVRARPAAARLRAGGEGIAAVEAFSRGQALDRDWMGWGALRVLSRQDWAPGAIRDDGRVANMERLLLVLQGALDADCGALGRARVDAGGALWIGCGHGLESRLANASGVAPLRLLECWLQPSRVNATPAVALLDLGAGKGPGGHTGAGTGDHWSVLPPGGAAGDARTAPGVQWMLARATPGDGAIALPRSGDAARYWLEVLEGEATATGDGGRLRAGDGLAWMAGAPAAPAAIAAAGSGLHFLLFALPA